jgi:hypothetical protein
MVGLAALIAAGSGTPSPGVCGRWPPDWLPGVSLVWLMFEPSNVVTIPFGLTVHTRVTLVIAGGINKASSTAQASLVVLL